jgi:hypothetical protein
VRRVDLWEFDPPVLGDDDTLLWRIRARPGVTHDRFVVGEVPRGFSEGRALKEALMRGTTYSATVTTDFQSIALNVFDPAELKTDSVLVTSGVEDRVPDPGAIPRGGNETMSRVAACPIAERRPALRERRVRHCGDRRGDSRPLSCPISSMG